MRRYFGRNSVSLKKVSGYPAKQAAGPATKKVSGYPAKQAAGPETSGIRRSFAVFYPTENKKPDSVFRCIFRNTYFVLIR